MSHLQAAAPPPDLRITLLGAFRVVAGGALIPDSAWRLRKAAALVKLLALAPAHALHREQLLDALWPDLDPAAATRNLRYALHVARGVLEGPPAGLPRALHLEGERVVLRPRGGLHVDVAEFAAAQAAAWQAADPAACEAELALYGGELLPEDRYEDWAAAPRELLRDQYQALLHRLAELYEERGAIAQAIGTLERLTASEALDETAQIELMRLYALTGQRARAMQQYTRIRSALQRDLDAEPSDESRHLYAAILAGRLAPPGRPRDAGAPPPPPGLALPVPTTSFIGRERDLAELRRLLAAPGGPRLITLTGVGGAGKTRLALEIAGARRAATSTGSCWFADLAPVTDPALVPAAVARALGLSERTDLPLHETLIAELRDQEALLIFDNCEHLIEACAELAQALLTTCPQLRLLATSREALRLPGELIWQVAPLSLPALATDPGDTGPDAGTIGRWQESEAVRLFCARATLARPDFALTPGNAAAVATICRRLDGIPLAIELAAVLVTVLSPAQIAARLDDAPGLLAGGTRGTPSRQQTLRATLDWSYDLLAEPERIVFRRLAHFSEGWIIDAAEAVCAGAGIEPAHVLTLLARLVDQSLVQTTEEGTAIRFRLLGIIRQYALEHLAFSGEGRAIGARHCAYFLALAEEAEPHLSGPGQADWLVRLDHERANLGVALRWAEAQGEVLHALRLAGALWWFWYSRGAYREGRDALCAALRLAGQERDGILPDDPPLIAATAKVLLGACVLSWRGGDYVRARTFGERALALYRALDNRRGTAWTLIFLAHVCGPLHDVPAGTAYIEEALELFRAIGDAAGLARTLNALGETARHEGDYARAAELYAECLALDRTLGNTSGLALRLMNLGGLALRQGDLPRAITLLQEGLELSLGLENTLLVANCLDGLAAAATLLGRPPVAARLFGAADALLERAHATRAADPPQQSDYDHYGALTRAALDGQAAEAGWAEGRALPLDQAVELARRTTAPTSDCASPHPVPPQRSAEELSRREREVAELIAAGRTNAQIAAALGMSTRTADTHVGHILRKLGFASRAEIAAWAREIGAAD